MSCELAKTKANKKQPIKAVSSKCKCGSTRVQSLLRLKCSKYIRKEDTLGIDKLLTPRKMCQINAF